MNKKTFKNIYNIQKGYLLIANPQYAAFLYGAEKMAKAIEKKSLDPILKEPIVDAIETKERIFEAIETKSFKPLTEENYHGREEIEYKVNDTIDDLTGVKFEKEAQKICSSTKIKYESTVKVYNKTSKKVEKNVQNYVDEINRIKYNLKKNLFVRMAKQMKSLGNAKFEDFPYETSFCEKMNLEETLNFELNDNSNYVLIHFVAGGLIRFNPIAFAMLEIGCLWYNRNKAINNLREIKDKAKAAENTRQQILAEIVRLQWFEKSIKNITECFRMIQYIFESLLDYVDEVVNYMKSNKLDKFQSLPLNYQEQITAIFAVRDICKNITERKIIQSNDDDEIVKLNNEMTVDKLKVTEIYKTLDTND